MTRIIRAGIVQQSCSTDIKTNLEKLHRNIASLAQAGANLVVLQELHNTPYFCQTEDTFAKPKTPLCSIWQNLYPDLLPVSIAK